MYLAIFHAFSAGTGDEDEEVIIRLPVISASKSNQAQWNPSGAVSASGGNHSIEISTIPEGCSRWLRWLGRDASGYTEYDLREGFDRVFEALSDTWLPYCL